MEGGGGCGLTEAVSSVRKMLPEPYPEPYPHSWPDVADTVQTLQRPQIPTWDWGGWGGAVWWSYKGNPTSQKGATASGYDPPQHRLM